MRLFEHIDRLLSESVGDWPRPPRGGFPIPRPPQDLTLDEFASWTPPRPSPGKRFLYHATDRRNVEKIVREGIRADIVKSPPAGTIWAATEPTAYSETKDIIWFEVSKKDPSVEYVAGNEAMVHRSVEPDDIVYIDLYFPMAFNHYSQVRTGEYAEHYWRDANGLDSSDLYESVQKETSKVDSSTKRRLKNLKPNDTVTVYHGTSTSYLQDFLDGMDLTASHSRQYGGSRKHAGLFVTPSFDEAARFGPNLVFELNVPAKLLYGVDWDGRTRKDGVRRGVSPENADEWYPDSFRPYMTATMLQSSEPQAILIGRLKTRHINRVYYKDKWWTPEEMVEKGVEYYPGGSGKPEKVRSLGFDPNDTSLDPAEWFEAVGKAIGRDPDRIEKYLGIYAKTGRDYLVDKMVDGFGFKIGRQAADEMADKLMRYFGLEESKLISEGMMSDISFKDVMNHTWRGRTIIDQWLFASESLYHEFVYLKQYRDLYHEDIPGTLEFTMWNQSGFSDYPDQEEAIEAFLEQHGRDTLDVQEVKNLRGTKTFDEWAREWAEDKFHEVKSTISRKVGTGNRITLWREMRVPDNWLEHLYEQGDHLGIYWTWDKSGADAYWASRGRGSKKAVIQSSIRSDRVDWVETIARNMDPDLGEMEKEIRLFKNTPIKIERLWINDKEVDIASIADKKFRA